MAEFPQMCPQIYFEFQIWSFFSVGLIFAQYLWKGGTTEVCRYFWTNLSDEKGGLYNGRAVTWKVTPRLFGADCQIRCLLLSQLVNPLHIESQTGGACTS